jgi:hypothetical protein
MRNDDHNELARARGATNNLVALTQLRVEFEAEDQLVIEGVRRLVSQLKSGAIANAAAIVATFEPSLAQIAALRDDYALALEGKLPASRMEDLVGANQARRAISEELRTRRVSLEAARSTARAAAREKRAREAVV